MWNWRRQWAHPPLSYRPAANTAEPTQRRNARAFRSNSPPNPRHSRWARCFEQALLLYLDGVIVLRLMERLGLTQEDMERVHSNLP